MVATLVGSGAAVAKLYASTACNPTGSTDPAMQTFAQTYQQRFNEIPGQEAAVTYDSFFVLKAAIEKAGSTDPEKVRTALAGIEYDGVIGKIRFDDHNQVEVPMALIQVEGGKAVVKGTFTTKIQYPPR